MIELCSSREYSDWLTVILNWLKTNIFARLRIEFRLVQVQNNPYRLLNAKSSLYIYITYLWFVNINQQRQIVLSIATNHKQFN